jgi:ubiquinone/menaquinone biosynthesis C-methylase UbiE
MMEARKLELKRLYDKTSDHYDKRYAELQCAKYSAIMKYLPEQVGCILDLGCGTGLLLGELCKRGRLVVGVDASKEMLKKARGRGGSSCLVLADADSLPFRNGVFDCVVSITLLQNMPDPARTVRELERVLRISGTGILTSLKCKHSVESLRGWATGAGLEVEASGEIEVSEDVFCVVRKPRDWSFEPHIARDEVV